MIATRSRTWRRFGARTLVLALAVLLFGTAPVWAQESSGSQVPGEVDFAKLEAALMNPCENCGGKPLSGSYCGGATDAKAKMRRYAAEGQNEEQIVASFVADYGEWILAVPERTGFNILAWAVPIGALVVGGGLLSAFLHQSNKARRAAAGPGTGGGEPAPASSPDAARRPTLNLRREEIGDPGPAVIEGFLADVTGDEAAEPQVAESASTAGHAGSAFGSDSPSKTPSAFTPEEDRQRVFRERLARELEED